jgi:hypothetical protein
MTMGARYRRTVAQGASRRKGAAPLLATALALLSLLMPEAAAVVAKPMSLDELVEKSDVIFAGTVIAVESRWNDEHTRIYTYTTFRVDEYLKGSGGDTIVIESLGGVVGDMGYAASGVPYFRKDERAVLFTSALPSGARGVTGWNQGRFRIQTHPQTGEETLVRSLAGVSFARQPSKVTIQQFSAIRTLEDLRSAVRSRVRR